MNATEFAIVLTGSICWVAITFAGARFIVLGSVF